MSGWRPRILEDDDLLEMVNAGLIRTIVVDNYLAEFWKQVFPDITVHGSGGAENRRLTGRRRPQGQSEAQGRTR